MASAFLAFFFLLRLFQHVSGHKADRDGEHIWRTVGCSTVILETSWLALADALEYWLVVVHDRERAQMLA